MEPKCPDKIGWLSKTASNEAITDKTILIMSKEAEKSLQLRHGWSPAVLDLWLFSGYNGCPIYWAGLTVTKFFFCS